MTPRERQRAALIARTALAAHCLCLRIETDESGYLVVGLPAGYAVDMVRVRDTGRADGYRAARNKLEEIWKESLAPFNL